MNSVGDTKVFLDYIKVWLYKNLCVCGLIGLAQRENQAPKSILEKWNIQEVEDTGGCTAN